MMRMLEKNEVVRYTNVRRKILKSQCKIAKKKD